VALMTWVSPWWQLAKKYGGGPPFGKFVNAVLRKLPQDSPEVFVSLRNSKDEVRSLPLPQVRRGTAKGRHRVPLQGAGAQAL
jgi:hypothetical protein